MSPDSRPPEETTPTRAQLIFSSWTQDVLIYVTVLGLFVEWVDAIVIDSFTISILTAIVLKALVDLILKLEHGVSHFFEQRSGSAAKVLRVLSMWLILFTSKFVILEVIDLIFGEHVELGKFIHVLSLVLVMMIAREVIQRIYDGLGRKQAEDEPS